MLKFKNSFCTSRRSSDLKFHIWLTVKLVTHLLKGFASLLGLIPKFVGSGKWVIEPCYSGGYDQLQNSKVARSFGRKSFGWLRNGRRPPSCAFKITRCWAKFVQLRRILVNTRFLILKIPSSSSLEVVFSNKNR